MHWAISPALYGIFKNSRRNSYVPNSSLSLRCAMTHPYPHSYSTGKVWKIETYYSFSLPSFNKNLIFFHKTNLKSLFEWCNVILSQEVVRSEIVEALPLPLGVGWNYLGTWRNQAFPKYLRSLSTSDRQSHRVTALHCPYPLVSNDPTGYMASVYVSSWGWFAQETVNSFGVTPVCLLSAANLHLEETGDFFFLMT